MRRASLGIFSLLSIVFGACTDPGVNEEARIDPAPLDEGGAASAGAVRLPGGSDPCLAIAPSGDPAGHHATIAGCLATKGRAVLSAGVHVVSTGIVVPAGASLEGSGATSTTLTFAGPAGNTLVSLRDGSTLASMHLAPRGFLDSANGAIVHIDGDNATVKGCRLENVGAFSLTAGVYFIGKDKSGSAVVDTEILSSFYGVIFAGYLDAAHPNRVERTKIHGISCDGVTLAGYGEVRDSEIWDVGFDCQNPTFPGGPPIPGAAIYALDNGNGGLVAGCQLHDSCGNVVDVDRSRSIRFESNAIYGPSHQRSPFEGFCVGGAAVSIVDSANLVLRKNVIANDARPQSAVGRFGDPNFIFGRYGDLPSGANQAVAFWLTRRINGAPTTGNVVDENEIRASCDAPCVGLGYFVGRRTGVDSAGNWSADTTNYFTRNRPFGSNIGSKRCGRNWYAGNSTCGGDPDCNGDDEQHPAVSEFRNDACP